MKFTEAAVQEAADELYAAQGECAASGPVSEGFPGLDVAGACAIQRANLSRRLGDGHTLVAHKIGLTSEPMQTLLGVEEPDFGYILDDMVLTNGEAVAASRFCAPRVEPEVAFLLRKPLHGPVVTVNDVYAATEAVAPALEIVDSRIADWKLTLPDTIADNASSGAVVLGDWVPYRDDIDLLTARASLWLNGTEIDSGVGSAVMGDPAAAGAWLANALARFRTQIPAGPFIRPGDVAATIVSGVGAVSLSFT